MNTSLRAELELAAEPKTAKTLREYLERMKPELAKLLPTSVTPERFARVVLTEARRTPRLFECDPASVAGAMMLSAQLELEPGPLGLVYYVPYKHECQFVLGYKGMVELAYRSGVVKDLDADVVHEGDAFEWRKGTTPLLRHTPAGPPGERPWTHTYAVARMKTGGVVTRVVFPEEVEEARKRSPNSESPTSAWNTDYFAMVRKTAVRRLFPLLPKSPAVVQAMSHDEEPVELVELGELGEGE